MMHGLAPLWTGNTSTGAHQTSADKRRILHHERVEILGCTGLALVKCTVRYYLKFLEYVVLQHVLIGLLQRCVHVWRQGLECMPVTSRHNVICGTTDGIPIRSTRSNLCKVLVSFIQIEVPEPEQIRNAASRRTSKACCAVHIHFLAVIDSCSDFVNGLGQCLAQALWVEVHDLQTLHRP